MYNLRMNTENELINIIDYFPFIVWHKDTEGRFINVNQKFVDASVKTSMKEIIGKTDLDLWPEELATKYRSDDEQVMKRLTEPTLGVKLLKYQ